MSQKGLENIRPEKLDEFKALKQEAWSMKKASGVKHHEALDKLAVARGFKNWSMLALNWSVSGAPAKSK